MKNIKSFSYYFVAALSLAIMPFAQAANRTISANYTLTANEDWTGKTVDIASGVTVNLNGYSLQIGSVGVIGEGLSPVFTGTSGELRISVPEGKSFANPGWSVEGSVDVVKDGPGLFVWGGGTLAATIPITVTDGVFRLGVTTANVFGEGGKITVAGTGQFDINYGTAGGSSPVRKRTFYIEGEGPDGSGAIYNSATANMYGYHLERVIMTGDATIGGVSRMDFRGGGIGIDGEGYTLTIKNQACLAFCGGNAHLNCKDLVIADGGVFQPCQGNTTTSSIKISGFIILRDGGVFASYNDRSGAPKVFNAPVIVGEGGGVIRSDKYSYQMNGSVTVSAGNTLTIGAGTGSMTSLTLNQGATVEISDASANLSVTGEFVNNGTLKLSNGTVSFPDGGSFGGTLVLAGGTVSTSLSDVTCPVVFDLSEKTEPFTIPESWLTLPENKQVKIDISGRRLVWGEKLLSWNSAPSLAFSLSENSALLVKKEDGLYFGDCDIVPVSATWTGAANNGLFFDVANWTCLDEKRRVIL